MVRLRASKAGGTGSIPGWGTKIPHAVQHGEKNKINNKMFNLPENIFEKEVDESPWDFPGGPVVRLHTPHAGGLSSISGQGTRFHMLQLRLRAAK